MEKNIVLIGFMGTGKSTIGVKLAERLKMKFVDMDREVEKVCGMTIAQLFKKYGEIRFRSEEHLIAKKLSRKKNLVIATGGGVVLNQENIDALKQNGILICLEADPQVIWSRVNRKKGTRPLLQKNVQVEDIVKMLNERKNYYDQADYHLDTSSKETGQIVQEIIDLLKKEKG
jgi:shikimate kinase